MPPTKKSVNPIVLRRTVSTIPTRDPLDSKLLRKFSTSLISNPLIRTPSRLNRVYIFFLLSTALVLFYILRVPAPCVRSEAPFSSTDILTRWKNPNFVRQHLRIFIYDLPKRFNHDLVELSIRKPGPIRDPQCDKNFYSSEVHVHRFLLQSAVRTMDPEEADFFYVPIYTTCDLITHQPNDLSRVGANFQYAMRIVKQRYPYWNRTNGRDHIFLFAQGFSARLSGNWTQYKNAIFMVHNGEFTSGEYTPHKDFTIPPELRSYFDPYWLDLSAASRPIEKKYLAHFGGQVIHINVSDHRGANYSGGVRQYIQAHLKKNSDYRITGVRSNSYISDMKKSRFCLAPEGWHPWSPRPYYSVLLGCIPVIISEVQELAFEEFIDWDSFAVWVRPADISKLDNILRSFSDQEIERRMQAMKKVWRTMWYARDGLANEAILRSLYLRKYDSPPRRNFSVFQ